MEMNQEKRKLKKIQLVINALEAELIALHTEHSWIWKTDKVTTLEGSNRLDEIRDKIVQDLKSWKEATKRAILVEYPNEDDEDTIRRMVETNLHFLNKKLDATRK
jgi:hypothetical protein